MDSASGGFAKIPSVDRVLNFAGAGGLINAHGRRLVADATRQLLADIRAGKHLMVGDTPGEAALLEELGKRLRRAARPRLTPVFNLTGTVLHTNLGRALLPEEAVSAVVAAMTQPVALEYDLDSGARGDRDTLVEDLLCELTGAEAATVVNNNAAAVFLLLNTLALRKEVIVSRGELIEIGGAFRIPDIMRRAGAKLIEVGTTNRTHPGDYADAVGARTAMMMKVHCSNYAVSGFTAAVAQKEVAALAHARGLPFVADLGSGTLVDLSRFGLPPEPTPQTAIADGVDLVTFSGDKLLGGPQAGILAGRKELVQRIRKNPLKRALRVGKLTLAALEAVLRLYRDPDRLPERLTTLKLLTRPQRDIEEAARRLQPQVAAALQGRASVAAIPMMSQIGGGSLPLDLLPSYGLAISAAPAGKRPGRALTRIEEAFRGLPVPAIGFVKNDMLQFDLRCLHDEAGFLDQLSALNLSASGAGR